MDEIIVRVCRTLASHPRLQLLSLLVREGELPPSELATKLGRPMNQVCLDLHHLSVAGLVVRRKSGRWCYYRAESPYRGAAFSAQAARWFARLTKQSAAANKDCAPLEVRTSSSAAEASEHDDLESLVFDAATAFTDLRRLRILRYLLEHGSATVGEITRELRMSTYAAKRHLGKLVRRGYVARDRDNTLRYALAARYKSSVHRTLFAIVRSQWAAPSSRASRSDAERDARG